MNTADQTIRVVFVGPPNTGKSCIVSGYKNQYKSTIGIDYEACTYKINGKNVKFQLWDISASMTFKDQNLQYCKNGEIVVCVYSANSNDSFNQCQNLVQRLAKQNRLRYNAKFVLVSTKNDLQIQVEQNKGYQMAQILKGNPVSLTKSFFQISNKTDPNSRQALCKGIYDVFKDQGIKTVSQLCAEHQSQSPAPKPIPQYTNNINAQPQIAMAIEKIYKVVLIGESETGKTAIMRQFANEQFSEEYLSTIGVDFAIRKIQVDGIDVKLQIWDTAGLKKFRAITSAYLKGCHIFLVVYDCSNVESFQNMAQHIQQISKHSNQALTVCKYIVANKIDKQAKISRQQGEQYAKSVGYGFMEVSAKDNININQLFYNAVDFGFKKLHANPM